MLPLYETLRESSKTCQPVLSKVCVFSANSEFLAGKKTTIARLKKKRFCARLLPVAGVTVAAPAKLNLHLRVGGKRPDGFHDIESLFLALDFGDTLRFRTRPGANAATEIRMDWRLPPESGPVPNLSPEKNIVSKAVSLFRERTGYDAGLEIVVEKRVPLGGGLGGGSSDAAATLLALNRLAAGRGGIPDARGLVEMGAELGSDVPFFARGAALAWVGGRGERVLPVAPTRELLGLSVLLVNPGVHSDTGEAFRALDARRKADPDGQRTRDVRSEDLAGVLAGHPRDWPFFNDFLSVFDSDLEKDSRVGGAGSVYREIIMYLRALGAGFAGLSGSGSTCFGVFSERDKAAFAKNEFSKRRFCVIKTFCLRAKRVLC